MSTFSEPVILRIQKHHTYDMTKLLSDYATAPTLLRYFACRAYGLVESPFKARLLTVTPYPHPALREANVGMVVDLDGSKKAIIYGPDGWSPYRCACDAYETLEELEADLQLSPNNIDAWLSEFSDDIRTYKSMEVWRSSARVGMEDDCIWLTALKPLMSGAQVITFSSLLQEKEKAIGNRRMVTVGYGVGVIAFTIHFGDQCLVARISEWSWVLNSKLFPRFDAKNDVVTWR